MAEDMDDDWLNNLSRLADEATPGPWLWDDEDGTENMGYGSVYTMGDNVMGGSIAGPTGDLYPRSGYNPKADMIFIAEARDAVPMLIAEVRRYRSILKQIKALREAEKSAD